MKKILLCVVCVIMLGEVADAQKQKKTKAPVQQKTTATKKAATQKKPAPANQSVANKTYELSHTNNANAFSGRSVGEKYFIADTTLRILNTRAATGGVGSNVTIRDITGVGKGAYGIFKGRLTLIPLGARTSGSSTGGGSVGTGTSPGLVGAYGPTMGLNGKNPYAGSSVYGTLRPGISLNDSITNRWVRE